MDEKRISEKNHTLAVVLAIFLGGFGAHRFYLERTASAILWLLTGGIFGIGWFLDVVCLLGNCFEDWSKALVVSSAGKQRIIANGLGAEKNSVCDIFCWIFVGIAALCAIGVFVAGIRGMEPVFFAAPVGGAVYFGILAWILSDKVS